MSETIKRPDIKAITAAGGSLPIHTAHGHVAFATVHPQWGGYCFPCVVLFAGPVNDGPAMPCFEVLEWHDGDYATDTDEPTFERHYCDPHQILGFAITIMEQMVKAGYEAGDDVLHHADRLRALVGT